jgi:hypothetical protein
MHYLAHCGLLKTELTQQQVEIFSGDVIKAFYLSKWLVKEREVFIVKHFAVLVCKSKRLRTVNRP